MFSIVCSEMYLTKFGIIENWLLLYFHHARLLWPPKTLFQFGCRIAQPGYVQFRAFQRQSAAAEGPARAWAR